MIGSTDIHSHILPGVDDGAKDIAQTKEMLLAAKKAGVSSIIASPHAKTPNVDTERIHNAYLEAKRLFAQYDVELRLGFECDYSLLLSEPDMRRWAAADTNIILLEFALGYLPMQWENKVVELQRLGLDVIIAHPERYAPIQQESAIAERMAQIGCELQVSADSLFGGMFSRERKCALSLLNRGYISHIASDAHCAEDYQIFERACKRYGYLVKQSALLPGAEGRSKRGGS